MPEKNSNIKRGLTKTLLIILGVIIALLMTIHSPIFTADHFAMPGTEEKPEPVADLNNGEEASEKTGSSAMNYNSATRLLHIFTENLPYLNNK